MLSVLTAIVGDWSKDKDMPLIPGVMETFDKLKGLHKIKNDDYAGDKGTFYNFEVSEWFINLFKGARDKVYAGIIGIKIARLSVVLYKPPSNESVEDTFDDIITYTAIWKSDWVARNKRAHQRVEDVTIRETPLKLE